MPLKEFPAEVSSRKFAGGAGTENYIIGMMKLKKAHRGLVEKFHSKKLVYSGVIDFRADTVVLPNGKKATRQFIAHPGAVAVLPLLPDGRVIFVRQYRYPVKEATLEIPAGKMRSAADSPLVRAKAELKEETGYTAARIKPLFSFWPSTAFSDELLRIYTAEGLRRGTPSPDDDEFINTEVIPFDKAWDMVRRGGIKDAKTVIALQAWKIRLLSKQPTYLETKK